MEERDRISELPIDILDKILGLLPIVEAARIAILSTKLRDVWSSLTQLKFDHGFCNYIRDKYSSRYRHVSSTSSIVMYVINKVLTNHNGLILKVVFEFKFPTIGRYLATSRAFEFDQWLLYVTQKGVKEIYFTLYDGENYEVPDYVFSCQTLERLHLHGVSVELRDAPCILQNVTSLCATFGSWSCPLPLHCFADVPMLENQSLSNCGIVYVPFCITAPKLGTLKHRSEYDTYPWGRFGIDLKSLCTLDLDSHSIQDVLENVIEKFTSRERQPQPPTLNLECLKISISDFHEYDDTMSAFIIRLLQMCPKLCKLEFHISEVEAEKVVHKLLKEVHKETQLYKTLHALELSSFNKSWSKMRFITRLPFYFPTLGKIVIRHAKFDTAKEFRIMQRVLNCIRSSTEVEVIET